MEADIIYEVLEKLVGRVDPEGDSSIDGERYENMKKFIEIFDKMHIKIDDIAYRYKDSQYASEKRIGLICDEHLDKMGIEG